VSVHVFEQMLEHLLMLMLLFLAFVIATAQPRSRDDFDLAHCIRPVGDLSGICVVSDGRGCPGLPGAAWGCPVCPGLPGPPRTVCRVLVILPHPVSMKGSPTCELWTLRPSPPNPAPIEKSTRSHNTQMAVQPSNFCTRMLGVGRPRIVTLIFS
jgi:hypothetical protein